MKGKKTTWTHEMLRKLKEEFPKRFSRDIGKDMDLSIRTIIRKARELNLEKEEGFLDTHRNEITKRAQKARPENETKGDSSFRIPGGEKHQFKKGQPRPKVNYVKIHATRNATIEKEKMRLRWGKPQKTKLKLVNYWK